MGEIPFTDKGGDDIDFGGIDQIESVTQRRFFFPEAAMDFSKEGAAADCIGMQEVRGG